MAPESQSAADGGVPSATSINSDLLQLVAKVEQQFDPETEISPHGCLVKDIIMRAEDKSQVLRNGDGSTMDITTAMVENLRPDLSKVDCEALVRGMNPINIKTAEDEVTGDKLLFEDYLARHEKRFLAAWHQPVGDAAAKAARSEASGRRAQVDRKTDVDDLKPKSKHAVHLSADSNTRQETSASAAKGSVESQVTNNVMTDDSGLAIVKNRDLRSDFDPEVSIATTLSISIPDSKHRNEMEALLLRRIDTLQDHVEILQSENKYCRRDLEAANKKCSALELEKEELEKKLRGELVLQEEIGRLRVEIDRRQDASERLLREVTRLTPRRS